MSIRFYLLSTIVVFLAFCGCKRQNEVVEVKVASVGESVLTLSQLCAAIPQNVSTEDSAVIADEYVRRWINQQVVMQKAELNLSDEDLDIEEAIEEYRRALIVERYQQKVVDQKFRPVITDKEIEDYFEKMTGNFKLNESIMKGVMAVLPKNVDGLKEFRKRLKFSQDDDFSKVENFLFSNSKNYSLSLDKWITLSSVRKFLPLVKQPADNDIKGGKIWEYSDDENIYILLAIEMKLVDEVAPLEYVKDKIYTILLNKKKIDFIKRLSADLYNEALQNDQIKFYRND